ncbi:MAG: mycofactocin biosynthesis glycosyltransferase MftF [Deltaproteobacteria bacterium]|nr:mycofactocin biosynthesis glycosyltransferase MftF [Deltaproteobacteria bacterium]
MSYRLAPGVSRVQLADGPALLARVPLRLVRVNEALARLLGDGAEVAARSLAERRALEALAERGWLRVRRGPPAAEEAWPAVSVVIPVRDREAELGRCLASLSLLRHPPGKLEILVVDDGSRDRSAEVARRAGARVLSSGGEGRGPAAARNRAAAVARGEILAFLDSDCTASAEWLAELLEPFSDPEVAAVGGMVEGMHRGTALDRYEAEMSSLSLGRQGRSAGAGADTFYLPSCNLLVRRSAFAAAGGFREELRVGEDVDLTWRLRDAGSRIVYLPEGSVLHEHRNRLPAFLRRRFEYGTSEALLHRLHPERRKRLVLPPGATLAVVLATAAALALSWQVAAGCAAVLLLDGALCEVRARRLGLALPPGSVALARIRGATSLAYHLALHLVRYYALVLLAGAVLWPRLGLLAAGMALGAAAVDHRVRRPALSFPAFLLLWLAEHLAYGSGVLAGCLRTRDFGSYRPIVGASDP